MLSLFEVYEHDLTLAMILQNCLSTEVSAISIKIRSNCILNRSTKTMAYLPTYVIPAYWL